MRLARIFYLAFRLATSLSGLVLLAGMFVLPTVAVAGQERYDYDALGRLVRVIDDQGRVTEYGYDAAGNILRVTRGAAGSAQAPTITSVTPAFLRRGESKQITVTGTNLNAVAAATSDPGLDVTALTGTATSVRFTLVASLSVPTGPQTLTFTSAAGTASAPITVGPKLPTLAIVPAPLAIPPDNSPRQFIVQLSNVDTIAHTISLVSSAPARATVSPASVTIAAGQLEARGTLQGVSAGQSTLTLSSATLATIAVPVFITAEFSGVSTSYAAPVGVVVQTQPNQTGATFPTFASNVGIAVGDTFIDRVLPRGFVAGTTVPITIAGVGLGAAQTVVVEPAAGVSVSNFVPSGDGRSATASLTVDSGVVFSERRLILRNGSQALPWLRLEEQVITVGLGVPEIESIEPIFGLPGQTVGFKIVGRNFLGLRSVQITPPAGIAVETSPVVNATGTLITTRFAIAQNAAPGSRAVTVTTLGGSTAVALSAANTFTIANEVRETYGLCTASRGHGGRTAGADDEYSFRVVFPIGWRECGCDCAGAQSSERCGGF
jgi:YD repeat-containing protein